MPDGREPILDMTHGPTSTSGPVASLYELLTSLLSRFTNRDQSILARRYGLFGTNIYTLEELGAFHGVTRERIRQIQERFENDLSKAVTSVQRAHELQEPKGNPILSEFLGALLSDFFISEARLLASLGIGPASDAPKPLLEVFLGSFRFARAHIGHSYYYLRCSVNLDRQGLAVLARAILAYLEKSIETRSLIDIFLHVRKSSNVEKETILSVLLKLEEVEVVQTLGEPRYQIKFKNLASLRDCAFRILAEKKEKMHVKEISRIIHERLAEDGISKLHTLGALRHQISVDPQIKNYGRTGYWALRQFSENTDTIEQLLRKALLRLGQPSDIKTLTEEVMRMRSDVKRASIQMTLTKKSGSFIKQSRGNYILKEWKELYPQEVERQAIPRKSLIQAVEEFCIESGRDIHPQRVLVRYLMEKGFTEKYARARLAQCGRVKKESREGIVYCVLLKPKPLKKEEFVLRARDLISSSPRGYLTLRELVNALDKTAGIPSTSAYTMISASKDLVKVKDPSTRSTYVLLRSNLDNSNIGRPEQIEMMKIIEEGEGSRVEFKATLRWDMRANRVNKDLELAAARTVCAFLNTDGGRLLIGVSDEGAVTGLGTDYNTFGKKDRDGFLLRFDEVVNLYLGRAVHKDIKPRIAAIHGNDLCIVEVACSDRPVFLREEPDESFYVRGAASNQRLSMSQALKYIESHWK